MASQSILLLAFSRLPNPGVGNYRLRISGYTELSNRSNYLPLWHASSDLRINTLTKLLNTGALSALLASALLSSTLLDVTPASATTLVGITSAAALAPNDSIDWAQLGAGDNIRPPSSFDVTSAAGESATVQNLVPTKYVQSGAGASTGWMGNFTVGDSVLRTAFDPDLLITFAEPVSAVGTQIESVGSGVFTGEITAFDSGGNILGTFDEAGLAADTGGDGSAIFIGLKSLSADIASVQFNISPQAIYDGTGTNFAINKLEFATSAVPEPTTWAMMLLGLGCVGIATRRRRLLGAQSSI
jgi:hypothetical protein